MTQKPTEKSVAVIGAGLAGLTAGALLTKRGYDVHIFEKESFIGGRALSIQAGSLSLEQYRALLSKFRMNIPFSEPSLETIFSKKLLEGYTLDLGYHLIGGGVVSNLQQIFATLNEHVDMLGSRLAYIHKDGFDYPYFSTTDKIKMLPQILRLLFSDEAQLEKLDQIPMSETIKKYGKGKMKLTLELFSRLITTVNNLDRISSGETFRAQKGLLGASTPVGYPTHGLHTISETLARYITKHHGTIHLSSPVTTIRIDDGCATGVTVNNQELDFDAVVSNILVQDLFTIAPEKHFPSSYVKSLQSLEGTGSLCAYYSLRDLDEKLQGKSFMFIERDVGVDGGDAVGMIDCITAVPKSGVAPASQYLVQGYIICTPEEAKNKSVLDRLKFLLDKQMQHLFPSYQSQLNWVLYPAIWQLDGVAKIVDNAKPEITTPINGLYLIGDCVKAPGIGMNCALNSAKRVDYLISRSK